MTAVWAWLDSLDTGQAILYALLMFTPVALVLLGVYTLWFRLLAYVARPQEPRQYAYEDPYAGRVHDEGDRP